MVIDWNDEDVVPTWANYLAMDKNGCWNWYEIKPILSESGEVWNVLRFGLWGSSKRTLEHHPNWKESLIGRYDSVGVASVEDEKAVDDALGLSTLTIRLDNDTIKAYEEKATQLGLIPKALMRAALESYIKEIT